MASKSNRISPPAPSSPSTSTSQPSKLPKFLQKGKGHREAGSTASIASSSSGGSLEREDSHGSNNINREKSRKSRLGGLREPRGEEKPVPVPPRPITTTATSNIELAFPTEDDEGEADERPVIIEPVPRPTALNPFPRPRTRSERPISDSTPSPGLYASPSGGNRIGDLPTRLSGWFSHTFSSSSTDLSLPSLLAQQQQQQQSSSASSPIKGAGLRPNALLTAARTGGRHLDKAVRYLLDSDAMPDRCTDGIWLLGVKHPGYEPPPALPPTPTAPGISGRRRSSVSVDSDIGSTQHERGSGFGIGRRAPSAFTYRTPGPISNSEQSLSLSQSQPPSSSSTPTPTPSSPNPNPATNWPPAFYADFTSRIWVTYRNQFMPIRDTSLQILMQEPLIPIVQEGEQRSAGGVSKGRWAWVPGVGEKVWTSDSGWGCMLRTGQSLLANALMGLYLGRDYRPPQHPQPTAAYATYVKLLTYFLDSPSPLAPFSVHRMALAGKELGTDVGCWFGPSVAAGAIKTLVHAFPEAGLGVSIAVDGSIYQSDVFSASSPVIGSPTSSSRHRRRGERGWGGRAVLVLVGIRLGIDGVNPIYYETIKALYTFPQSVGIAGGRPSSSYYFVGSQADNLFYLDPHHARPTVPLRPPPSVTRGRGSPDPDRERRDQRHQRMPTSPARSSTIKASTPPTPSPLAYSYSTTSNSTTSSSSLPLSSSPTSSPHPQLSEDEEHYVNAYGSAELRTFHCERVRKMPLSGLDPSMLLGFLCKDESDWEDFRRRVGELGKNYKTIFTVQDEPPTWPSDSDEFMGLESISEPDDMDLHASDEEDDDGEPFFDDTASKGHSRGTKSSDFDTEEDPMGPVTPGPGSRTAFDVPKVPAKGRKGEDDFEADELDGDEDEDEDEEDEDEEDDDSWVDPSVPTSPAARSPDRLSAPPMTPSKSNGSTSSGGSGTSRSKKSNTNGGRGREAPAHYPFPSSVEDTPGTTTREANGNNVRMHNARARDGGRTQSGGVKGVLTTDDGEPL